MDDLSFSFLFFPIVCTEGEERQIAGVLHITDLEVLKTVAHSHGVLNLRRADLQGFIPVAAALLPEVLGDSRMEHLVLTGNLKTLDVLEGCIGVVVVVEMDIDGITVDLHILESGTLVEDALETVVAVQGCIGQTFAYLLFLGRVNLESPL